jgi:hypothetical protein
MKVKASASGRAIRITGKGTEVLDFIESIWDAIPKRQCEPNPVLEGGEVCSNVSDCKGKRIKYEKPLHRAPRRKVRKDDGKWITVIARNAYGRPITHPRPQHMLQDIWNHWNKIDVCSAGQNLLTNEFKDFVIGKASKRTALEMAKVSPRPVGPSTGPAM